MPPRRHMRTIITVLAAMSAILALTLSTTGTAQAAGGGPAARPASGRTAHTTPGAQHSKPDGTVDQAQKSEQAHYTNAPCNRAEKNYLAQHLARCFSVVRTALDHQITPAADPPPTALGPADIQDAYSLPDAGDGQL